MEFIGWDVSYSVGHPRMDEHHRKLFALIANLEVAIASNDVLQEYDVEWEAARELANYATIHFAEEEAIMEAAGYPDLEAHKELHRFFMSRIDKLEYNMEVGGETPQLENLCEFLHNWLASHILGTDQQYVPYIKKAANQ